jgi:hypothetical protein
MGLLTGPAPVVARRVKGIYIWLKEEAKGGEKPSWPLLSQPASAMEKLSRGPKPVGGPGTSLQRHPGMPVLARL